MHITVKKIEEIQRLECEDGSDQMYRNTLHYKRESLKEWKHVGFINYFSLQLNINT